MTDCIEGAVAALLTLLVLLCVPLAVTVSMGVYHRELTSAAERTRVSAVLISDPVAAYQPVGHGVGPSATAMVQWQLPDGRQGSERLAVGARQRAGDRISIWVDRTGNRTEPPRSRAQVRTASLIAGVDLVLVSWLLVAVLWWVARWLLERVNVARWTAQWAYTGPRWSRRSWQ